MTKLKNRPKKRIRKCAGCYTVSTKPKRRNWTCPACSDVEVAARLIKRDGPGARFDTSHGDIVQELPPITEDLARRLRDTYEITNQHS